MRRSILLSNNFFDDKIAHVMIRTIFLVSLFTISIFSLATFVACKKDSCADVTCQNGGSCKSGACVCASGYSGTHCEIKSCAANGTAQIQFSNRSANSTYSVVWDGSITATLAPGVTSEFMTVAAGDHTLEFRYANSSTSACSVSTPVLAQCSSMVYWCSN